MKKTLRKKVIELINHYKAQGIAAGKVGMMINLTPNQIGYMVKDVEFQDNMKPANRAKVEGLVNAQLKKIK